IVGFKLKLFSTFLALLFLGPCANVQAESQHRPVPPFAEPAPQDDARARLEGDMAKHANQQRQAELKRDTDRLFSLASELKQYVNKSHQNVLSVEVMKKAEQIENLA